MVIFSLCRDNLCKLTRGLFLHCVGSFLWLIQHNNGTLSSRSMQLLTTLALQCQKSLLNTSLCGCMSDAKVLRSQFFFLERFHVFNTGDCIGSGLLPLQHIARIRLEKHLDPIFSKIVMDSLNNHFYSYLEVQDLVYSSISLAQMSNAQVSFLMQIDDGYIIVFHLTIYQLVMHAKVDQSSLLIDSVEQGYEILSCVLVIDKYQRITKPMVLKIIDMAMMQIQSEFMR